MKRLNAILLTLILTLGLAGAVYAGGDKGKGRDSSSKGLAVNVVGDASIWTDKSEYRVGDSVRVGFRSSVDGYAAIYDYSPDGTSQMIWPRTGSPSYVEAGRSYSLPDGKYNFMAADPVGTETFVLVVSKAKTGLTLNLNLSFIFGGNDSRRRGLTTDGQGNLVATTDGDGGSFSTQCTFNVIPKWSKPVLRINGGAGARLFVDGSDYGVVAGNQMTLEPGSHQVVVLLPGMRVEVKDLNMKANGVYDWWLKFRAAR